MGRREWEKADIVIPSSAWAGFKKELRDVYNKAMAADFELAKKVLERVKVDNKGKRNVDWAKVVWDEIHANDNRSSGHYGFGESTPVARYDFKVVSTYFVKTRLLAEDGAPGKFKLVAPKAKDFAPAKSTVREFRAGDEALIHLVDATRTVKWSVDENKSACEEARESLMGVALFAQLAKVKWGRQSGGAVYGNDEYSEDAGREHAGGGGSYLKETYGPLGDDQYERKHGFRPRRSAARAVSRTTVVRNYWR